MVSALYDRVIDAAVNRLAEAAQFSSSGCSSDSGGGDDDELTSGAALPLLVATIALSVLVLAMLGWFVVLPALQSEKKAESGLDESLMKA